MIKIGKVKFNNIPKIALVTSDKEDNALIKSQGIDFLEIRVDQFRSLDPEYIKRIILTRKELGIPLILTIRSKEEGGRQSIVDDLKLRIFRDSISLVDAIDIELRSSIIQKVMKLAKSNKKPVIVSWHDFKLTPERKSLAGILKRAEKEGADIIKVAGEAKKVEDVIRLMEFTVDNKARNIITISLGNIGVISRVLFPMLGSLITYSYIDKPSGPGQLSLKILQDHLRLYCPEYNHP